MKKFKEFFENHAVWFVLAISFVASISATAYYFHHGDIIAYNDARSHLDLARLVIDNVTPGLPQLGGEWLPLPHLLMMPFVANYYLWKTGLAGSIVSMGAFIASAVLIYRIAEMLSKQRFIGLTAACLFIFNPNILYLQSTPLTESLLLASLLGASYFFLRWVKSQSPGDLIVSGLFIFTASLNRYEGWFALVACVALVIFHGLVTKTKPKKIEGQSILLATLGSLGITLWLLYNFLIWGNPIYFLTSKYSAKAQQNVIAAAGGLPTKHNVILSATTMLKTINLNVGVAGMLLFIVALLAISVKNNKLKPIYFYMIALLAAPAILDFITLALGITTIGTSPQHLFNVRYGVMAVPLIAVVVSLAIARLPRYYKQLAVVIALVCVTLAHNAVLADGLHGGSAYTHDELVFQQGLQSRYHGGMILASVAGFNPVMQGAQIPLHDYIQEGNYLIWGKVIEQPQKTVKYILLINSSGSTESVYQDGYLKHEATYTKYYQKIYSVNGYTMYGLRPQYDSLRLSVPKVNLNK